MLASECFDVGPLADLLWDEGIELACECIECEALLKAEAEC